MDWRHRAACRDEDPELFFPVGHSGPALAQIDEAKRVCHRCPVASQCLTWALNSGQDAGVWGGMSEDERRALKRRNRVQERRDHSGGDDGANEDPRDGKLSAQAELYIAGVLSTRPERDVVAESIIYLMRHDHLSRAEVGRMLGVNGSTIKSVANAAGLPGSAPSRRRGKVKPAC